MWSWGWLLSFDVIAVIVITCAVIYCFCTSNRKKYTFVGLDTKTDLDTILSRQIKRKKGRRNGYNRAEERCREIFQSIFGERFKKVRPDWLRNPVTGKNLELDGYCPNVRTPLGRGLAFEYDGKQHAQYTPHFHKAGPNEFVYQTKKDSWKDLQCRKQGVVLIRIPHYILFEDLERYIKMRLRRNDVSLPTDGIYA